MELWRRDAAGLPDRGDDLTAPHRLAATHADRVVVAVGGHPPVGMAQDQKVAEARQLVAGIDDDAVLGRVHRGAARRRDVDAVVVQPAALRPEARQHLAPYRPEESGPAPRRRRLGIGPAVEGCSGSGSGSSSGKRGSDDGGCADAPGLPAGAGDAVVTPPGAFDASWEGRRGGSFSIWPEAIL